MARSVHGAARRVSPRTENGTDSSGNRRVRPPRRRMTGVWFVLMAFFFAQGLFYVWCRVQCVNAGYGIEREMNRRQELLKERSTLNIELNWLKSPERIETIARNQLGLVMPDAQQTVRLP